MTDLKLISTLLNSIPHIAWVIVPGELFLQLNEEWKKYTGLSSELSISSVLSQCVHLDDAKIAQQVFQKSSETNVRSDDVVIRLRRADGEFRWHLIRSKDGISTATDVHERVGSEHSLKRKLQDSQDRLAFTLQTARVGTWEINLKTNEVKCSPEMLEIWEINEGAGPLNREHVQRRVHPDDLQKMQKAIDAAIQSRSIYDLEYRLLFPSGQLKWVHSRGHCFYEEGSEQLVKFMGVVFDVTSEKLVQEEKFRLIVENVKDYAIYMLDLNGNVATWNEGARRIKGYEPHEIIGHHFSRFYLKSEQDEKPAQFLREASRLGHIENEGWRVRKDGSQFWASVVISAVRDGDGRLVGFSKVTRDLTERRRVEIERLEEQKRSHLLEKLKESEKTLDQIFQESPSYMALLRGPDLVFERANQKYFDLVGRDQTVLGKSVREVFPEVEEQGFFSILERVFATGERWVGSEVPVVLKVKNGKSKQIYTELVYQPMRDADGRVTSIVAQGYDVTEKVLARQAVERSKAAIEIERKNFRHLFRQTPEIVCILHGPDHLYEFVNEAHIRVLGFDATGMTVRQARPESVEVHGILDQVYRTGKTAELNEIPITVKDRLRYFNLTYAARRDEFGQVNGVMVLGTEVTEQVQSRETLREAIQARDTFMSIASHELKTPLSSLKLQVQMRKRAIKKGDMQRFSAEKLPRQFDDDERQINRIVRLVDDMLDVSRIQTGKLTLLGDEFDFREMVRDTLSSLTPQLELQGCQVTLDAPQEVCGIWDRFRIEQVFINLLSNASKYGSGKPVEVRLSADAVSVALAVKDHGMGIAPQDQDRIFEQFERAISANSISGLGLGLFISKKIVEAHQGMIHLESQLEKGSTFTIRLPLRALQPHQEVPLG